MILYEDNHLLVVYKPNGTLVQGDRTGDETIVEQYKRYIKEKYDKPGAVFLHPAHRLDRPVSGCLILGRTSKGLERISRQFQQNLIKKTYIALSNQSSEKQSGRLTHHLLKNGKTNTVKVVSDSMEKAKHAILDYQFIKQKGNQHLYKIEPHTGRSHQIRVQLAANQTPILGDVKYKGLGINDPKMIYLHCLAMSFIHPTKKEEVIVYSLPKKGKLWSLFDESLQDLIPKSSK